MIHRFSSRRERLDESFLNRRLAGASGYDRIAGYFRLSILEVAGEALEAVAGPVRIVCNSDIPVQRIGGEAASQQAQRLSWNQWDPAQLAASGSERLGRLVAHFDAKLPDGTSKLEVRVLPDQAFGLVHGKAGVIHYPDGSATAFLGSVNESLSGWALNYELLWEDDDPAAAQWVQEEFDALWNHKDARPLSVSVVDEIRRNARRISLPLDSWKEKAEPDPSSPVIETPVYREELGLWPHQKYFINLAFQAHKSAGARYVLADQVGLGKTAQLALSALLMTLHGGGAVLAVIPKSLIPQWQDELRDLLDIPSAAWTGKGWIDENGVEHPVSGNEGIKRCPRKFGIVSQGLVSRNEEVRRHLLSLTFECVIVDEAHRARRSKVTEATAYQRVSPNRLLGFVQQLSAKTRSMLLATATPIQLHPVEAWDLLEALNRGGRQVLGDRIANSLWLDPGRCVNVVMGQEALPDSAAAAWPWIRNPMPGEAEDSVFKHIRLALDMPSDRFLAPSFDDAQLSPALLTLLRSILDDYASRFTPFVRHIVRRTRKYLEETIDPATGQYYMKRIEAVLVGEEEPIRLSPYLQQAYDYAQEFCVLLGERVKGAGFLKTLLLRRIGSSIYAGSRTITKMLREWGTESTEAEPDAYEEDEEDEESSANSEIKNLTDQERAVLEDCARALNATQQEDPKFQKVTDYLQGQRWIEEGCIVFSQYYDSAWWLAEGLSKLVFPAEAIGLYASAQRSGIVENGVFRHLDRESIKKLVRTGGIRLLVGTDAASEGLNLQRLGTLINLDLPWNPTRLEQRKGRIQRIGQTRDQVLIYNMRYRGSVEDRVHQLLSSRLQAITQVFGQIPDILEDVWIEVALKREEEANKLIEDVPSRKNPFDQRYSRVENLDWESCSEVLDRHDRMGFLNRGW